MPALVSNPLGPAFTRRRWYVHQYLGAQHSHNAAGTSTTHKKGLAALRGVPACLECCHHSTITESPLSTWWCYSATWRGPVATGATAVLLPFSQRHWLEHAFRHRLHSTFKKPPCNNTWWRPPRRLFRMRGPRSHRGYTRIFTRLAKPALRSWVIADTLASPRGSQSQHCALGSSRIHSHLHETRKANIALLGHRGYTRISTRLAMLSHRSIPGAVTRDHRSHSGSYCVCGTWDFAHPGARRLTLESHPATKRGGRKLNGQSIVLPCVFTSSVVSDTPQRLWPGAQWTVAVQGTKGQHLVYGVEAQTAPRRKARRADEATAIAISPRHPKGPGALAIFKVSR